MINSKKKQVLIKKIVLAAGTSKRFGFKNPPVLNLVSDKSNTSPLGKTAHYDPNNMSITIYVDGRHLYPSLSVLFS